jgi:hypothetical protein
MTAPGPPPGCGGGAGVRCGRLLRGIAALERTPLPDILPGVPRPGRTARLGDRALAAGGCASRGRLSERYGRPVARFLLLLLGLWMALIVLGWVVKGLFWLAVVGLILFVGTAVLNASRRR